MSGFPPPSIAVGDFYSFVPVASDPEGRALTFSIRQKPAWASFDPKTGRLFGTPAEHDVGVHINIAISATDGRSMTTLPAFEIVVIQQGDGSVTLSWHPPTENSDGSPLNDLAGYRIYYGQNASELDRTIVLENPGLTRYVVEGLSSSHWHFAMTSVNRKGDESARSSIVTLRVG